MKRLIRAADDNGLVNKIFAAQSELKYPEVGKNILSDAGLIDTWSATQLETKAESRVENNDGLSIMIFAWNFTRNNIDVEVIVKVQETMKASFGKNRELKDHLIIECIGDGWNGAEIDKYDKDVTDMSSQDFSKIIVEYLKAAEKSLQKTNS